ncbi:LacI family transcriptional regulator [Lunatimonas lonarensis]|uniref:LacI family transcriptional regulator n=1 Tax=Lunatimonas lonarensis TaxID=1232681 RepID=R7ZMX0_9BACT|nr:LacI family DNA-binding transcriptional regulator [Lunatimonas lonarensis]EON75427.1 LacI family transcriptional regulator [Lunatimonas lonarensis]
MKTGQSTIKDIAKALKVSPSTVSRALKDYPGISEETKAKVKQLAEALNYRPNAVALSLRKRRSYTLGVIIPEVVHFFFSTVISGIEEAAIANGYNVILCQTNEDYSREVKMVETMVSNQIDGLLVSHSRNTEDFNHFQTLLDNHFPIVFFDRIPKLATTANVIVDDFQGAHDATKHLISQGYRDILHLAGPLNLAISQNRRAGYQQAMKDAGIHHPDARVIECPSGTVEESVAICLEVFSQPDRPDGIFASNDVAAAGGIQALKELGIQVPGEVGVVGFSNWQFSSMIEPPMSSVMQPGFLMGEAATKKLLNFIETESYEAGTTVLKTELIPRRSSHPKKC